MVLMGVRAGTVRLGPLPFTSRLGAFHRSEKLFIGLGHCQLVDQEFHRADFIHRVEDLTQDPHLLQLIRRG